MFSKLRTVSRRKRKKRYVSISVSNISRKKKQTYIRLLEKKIGMTSVELIPINSANNERKRVLCVDETNEPCVYASPVEDADNIPYHAREHARPFTYGNLPKDFKTSDLHHVDLPEESSMPQRVTPHSPYQTRKSTRPSISPSRPVLHKTPSREQFEEMLMERREKALLEQNNSANKLAREAAIQKDLNELQEKLSKRVRITTPERVEKTLEIVPALPPRSVSTSPVLPPRSPLLEGNEIVLASQIPRSDTPTFPVLKAITDGRSVSPYPNKPDETSVEQYSSKVVLVQHPEIAPHLVSFVRDSSEYWYKPHITRDEAVSLLRNATPGTFLIRNSSTYKNAFGLVLRVAKPPLGVIMSPNSQGEELVRHFLLEPTTLGVHLKGCANEPVFSSLSAFVYQHSINSLALPCKLLIPEDDVLNSAPDSELVRVHKQLLGRGAACNVLYLYSRDTESLTGVEAVRCTVNNMYAQKQLPVPVEVHFKVSQNGITITDNKRRTFFRRHYATQNVSYCGIDPENRLWRIQPAGYPHSVQKTIFGFVARTTTGTRENQCHIFCDLAASQPASAIISFTNKLLPTCRQTNDLL